MSKRSICDEVLEEAKKQAIVWQLKKITDDTQRQLKRPKRTFKCNFCNQEHHTADCQNIPDHEKIEACEEKNICIIFLGYNHHHVPAGCRALRFIDQLCQKQECGRQHQIHHKTVCPQVDYRRRSPSPTPSEMILENNDKPERQ